jgi:hypothetical protein
MHHSDRSSANNSLCGRCERRPVGAQATAQTGLQYGGFWPLQPAPLFGQSAGLGGQGTEHLGPIPKTWHSPTNPPASQQVSTAGSHTSAKSMQLGPPPAPPVPPAPPEFEPPAPPIPPAPPEFKPPAPPAPPIPPAPPAFEPPAPPIPPAPPELEPPVPPAPPEFALPPPPELEPPELLVAPPAPPVCVVLVELLSPQFTSAHRLRTRAL